MKEVIYCEWLFMGEPKETRLPLKHAIARYHAMIGWLKDHRGIASDGSFIGVKRLDGTWIIKN